MSNYNKKYESFKLFYQSKDSGNPSEFKSEKNNSVPPKSKSSDISLNDGMYYEIEYESSPIPGAGKFVLKSQKIEIQERDEIRDIFDKMRDIARKNRTRFYNSSKFYDKRVQQENSRIFYKQGMFMKDFEDDYGECVPYSSYFPYYQMMGYKQLRTYFTWRTKVRKGEVEDTSLSYAFLYIYELLNNIGVENPKDGLDKLMFFWKQFRTYNDTIDKYVIKWLKDYHIYYELPHSFKEFIEENDLAMYYPTFTESEMHFDLLYTISKYDIKKSAFYTDDRKPMIEDCFNYTVDQLITIFHERNLNFEDIVFYPTKKMSVWSPFKDALFYPWMNYYNKRVVFSTNEVYLCSYNKWSFSTTLTTESGKQLIGYIMKLMESILRKSMNYKYKLTANLNTVDTEILNTLKTAEISLENIVTDAVMEFYREATKTVVTVDFASLEKIRQEAWMTQEKLIIPEEDTIILQSEEKTDSITTDIMIAQTVEVVAKLDTANEQMILPQFTASTECTDDEWSELKEVLHPVEIGALRILLNEAENIKQYADQHGIMLEVLMDGINEKSMDYVGDSLMDEELTIYDDYIEQVKEMVREI